MFETFKWCLNKKKLVTLSHYDKLHVNIVTFLLFCCWKQFFYLCKNQKELKSFHSMRLGLVYLPKINHFLQKKGSNWKYPQHTITITMTLSEFIENDFNNKYDGKIDIQQTKMFFTFFFPFLFLFFFLFSLCSRNHINWNCMPLKSHIAIFMCKLQI